MLQLQEQQMTAVRSAEGAKVQGMRCEHCGRKLTAAAIAMGFCPHCGTLLGDAAPPLVTVQEVPGYAMTTQRERIGLPAGSEQVPSQQEAFLFPERGPNSGESPYTAQSATPLPPTHFVDAASPVSPSLSVTPHRNPLLGIVVTLLVVIIVGAGALFVVGQNGKGPFASVSRSTSGQSSATPTVAPSATAVPATATPAPPTATPQPAVPTPLAGFSTFLSADGVFGLNYPSAWTSTPTSPANGETFFNFSADFARSEFVQVVESATPISVKTVGTTYLANYAASSNGTNFQLTQDATSQPIGSNTWMMAQGTYIGNDGQHKVIALAIDHGEQGFLVFYDAIAGQYQTGTGSSYDTMVKSFTFLH
jgi:hypothetical protein